MSLLNTIFTALRGISGNKLRATLTTLGIIIGVASVIATLALGNGAREAVEASFRGLGADQISIAVKQEMKDGEVVAAGRNLTYQDGLEMPAAVPAVRRVAIVVQRSAKIRRGRTVLDTSVTGTTADALVGVAQSSQVQPVAQPAGQPVTEQSLIGRGRFFTAAEALAAADVCVLGYQTADDLFGADDALGEVVLVNRRPCEVIGVLAQLEMVDPKERARSKPNESFYMPISTAINWLYDKEPSVSITALARDARRIDEAKAQVAAYLRRRHEITQNEKGEYHDDFYMTTKKDLLGASQQAARAFSTLLAALAIVSLVVGGIGIMNVMLVSVTERTREIGVRLAIGARQRDVVTQFLLEAVILSALGGLLGIGLGILVIPLAASLNAGQALLDPNSIPLAFGVALLTGVIFGLYPALRAARSIRSRRCDMSKLLFQGAMHMKRSILITISIAILLLAAAACTKTPSAKPLRPVLPPQGSAPSGTEIQGNALSSTTEIEAVSWLAGAAHHIARRVRGVCAPAG